MIRLIRPALILVASLMVVSVAAQTPDSGIDPTARSSTASPGTEPAVPSFQKGTGSGAGGPANELNTQDGRARETLPGGSVADVATGRDLYHGNYCGRGNRGAGVVPTDDLDAACMRHDACYGAAGIRSCACDETLRREALAVADDPAQSRELRARSASVIESTALMNCQAP